LDDFINNRIARFDVSETNQDGSPKTKMELDMIRIIRTNFPYYIKLNDDIVKRLMGVLEPARKSSNVDLQELLKSMFGSDDPTDNKQYAMLDIYSKYIANTRKSVDQSFIETYMYTGVSTVVGSDIGEKGFQPTITSQQTVQGGAPDTNDSFKEMPEIYVYLNVVQKEEYEENDNRLCSITDDYLTNNLKHLLFMNNMMDSTFPEVNPYRVFKLLKGSENKTLLNSANLADVQDKKSIPNTPAENGNKNTGSIKLYDANKNNVNIKHLIHSNIIERFNNDNSELSY
jgi:hypothetical protein